MLLLIDLDNTLVDRTAAFKSWAEARFGRSHVAWLADADGNGYTPREVVAARIAARFGVDEREILNDLRAGMVDYLTLDPAVESALVAASAAGYVPFVVTNGAVAQQESKLRRTGLDRLVAGWTISEGAGARKPDRRIFETAAAAAGLPLSADGWMVGDNEENDVGGGATAGLRTGWVANGREWPAHLAYRPTATAANCATLLEQVIRLA
ncbi:HAD family hydrolase [Actinoplanes sp. NPDC026619]|uniref:HAD family hydrolase n=1 Tax=Actinoplanes sp. NPDC026619 TaxID=3155798 RepID=UPI0033DC099D